MTLIELFDASPIENVASALSVRPDKIIFVGEGSAMRKKSVYLDRVLRRRGHIAAIEYRSIDRTDVAGMTAALETLAEENPESVFDLTGGEDLLLFAFGLVYERYRERGLQVQWVNVRTGRICDCDRDGKITGTPCPALPVEDNILLHGGRILYEGEAPNGTSRWHPDAQEYADIRDMWDICRENCGLWNAQTTIFGIFEEAGAVDEERLTVSVHLPHISDLLEARHMHLSFGGILPKLAEKGLISYDFSGQYFFLTYKSEPVRRCLKKAGTVLELMTWLTAAEQKKKDGAPIVTDSLTGAVLTWNDDSTPDSMVTNEIDVLIMSGLQPVFISCKNGAVEHEELYKLCSVAEHFGGPFARKILVATTLGRVSPGVQEHIRSRAKEMQVELIEGVHEMSDTDFAAALRRALL